MLIKKQHLDGIRAGTVRCAYRRWRCPTVKAGGTLRTAVGVLAIQAVEPARLKDLTAADARVAGYGSLSALLAELRGREGQLYRVELSYQDADPRLGLRARGRPGLRELEDVLGRLERMDARSRSGPWTRRVLELLRDRPGVRAGDLAPLVGREQLAFKRDVRKLKELGLTVSLETGYRLSPRGRAVLRALRGR